MPPTDINQDEAILAQEKRIESEIADKIPLVSGPESLDKLLDEYAVDDSVYRTKIEVCRAPNGLH